MLNQISLDTLNTTVRKYLPDSSYKIFIFGSHATNTNRKFSDIDLGILGPKPVLSSDFESIKWDFHESNLPYRVDVVDFSSVPDRFKNVALNNTIAL